MSRVKEWKVFDWLMLEGGEIDPQPWVENCT
jgi:hypothetical protein